MKKHREKIIKGMLLAPGVAIGSAFVITDVPYAPVVSVDKSVDVQSEIEKLNENIKQVKKELAHLRDQAIADAGERSGEILDVQLLVIEDTNFLNEIIRIIEEKRVSYVDAVYEILRTYEDKFMKIKDPYLREKYLDLKDVLLRMLNRDYFKERQKELGGTGNRILVCEQMLPTTLLGFKKNAFNGIVTVSGGLGSHAAILARSYGVPAIGVAKGITKKITDGAVIFVDGYNSSICLNPTDESRRQFLKETEDYNNYRSRIKTTSSEKTKTKDGHAISILANCGALSDVRDSINSGANGIGLFRTEIMFYSCHDFPNEDEQFEFYRNAVKTLNGHKAVFRTLDLGGDKSLPYFLLPRQINPHLGWRSLKISFDHPDEFKTQLRAILRAAAYGNIRLMFPMVTNYSDIVTCKRYLAECKEELKSRNIEHSEQIEIGAMIETPSAVACLLHILPEVDFISVGTNDLIQHILAVDRDNPKVSQFYVAHHPAVLRTLNTIFEEASRYSCPFSVCGEMASNPLYAPILIGMGLRRFSMAPNLVPILKDVIRHLSVIDTKSLFEEVMGLRTSEEVLHRLREYMQKHYPDFNRIA